MINKCKISLCCCVVLGIGTGCGPKNTGPSADTIVNQSECAITVRSQGISDLFEDVRQAVTRDIDTLKLYCQSGEISKLDTPDGINAALPLSTSSKGRHVKVYAGDVSACKVFGQNPNTHGGHLIFWTAQRMESQICLTRHSILVSIAESPAIEPKITKIRGYDHI